MKSPIYDFLREYSEKNKLRLHMPGHKGVGALGIEAFDLTEVDGADVLYRDNGIILESRSNASKLFGTAETLYSTEGSSLSIRAMLFLVKKYALSMGKTARVLAGRNAHRSFMSAVALSDIEVSWLYPSDESLISCNVTASDVECAIKEMSEPPTALYLTAPDYLGNIPDIRSIAEVCRGHDVLLIVDNAHGAYLKFLPNDIHPISLGACMCADSAHKTLPALTGSGYLHISSSAPKIFREWASEAMSLFASTSPSYLILASLDALNGYLADGYSERLSEFAKKSTAARERLIARGLTVIGDEPLKLTVSPKSVGYTGYEIAAILSEHGIEVEFADSDYVTMMMTPEQPDAIERLTDILVSIEHRTPITKRAPRITRCERVLGIREALFAPSEELPSRECVGRVLASSHLSCPPAIPIAIPGERLSEEAVSAMLYYGIDTCKIIK